MPFSYIYFFFSSRRRHTISLCDWSSDVCSSDLIIAGSPLSQVATPRTPLRVGSERINRRSTIAASLRYRSEERRVGKECRSRGWWKHSRKKGGGDGSEHESAIAER